MVFNDQNLILKEKNVLTKMSVIVEYQFFVEEAFWKKKKNGRLHRIDFQSCSMKILNHEIALWLMSEISNRMLLCKQGFDSQKNIVLW